MFKNSKPPLEPEPAAPLPEVDYETLIEKKVTQAIGERHIGGRPITMEVIYSPIEELAQKMGWWNTGYPSDLEEIMRKQGHSLEELLGPDWDVESLAALFDANTEVILNAVSLAQITYEDGMKADRLVHTPEHLQVKRSRTRPQTPREREEINRKAEEDLKRARLRKQQQHLEMKARALQEAEEEFRAARDDLRASDILIDASWSGGALPPALTEDWGCGERDSGLAY